MSQSTLILRTAAPAIATSAALASLYILVRGHNDPGGGFLGGLLAASGVVFLAIAHGREAGLKALVLPPAALCALGLVIALASGLPAFWVGQDFMTALWWLPDVGFKLAIGTPLLFDVGVYLTVLGAVAGIFLMLWEA